MGKQLEVGDKLYSTSHYGVHPTDPIVIIDRVTPKMAFWGNRKFTRELRDNGIADQIGLTSYTITTYKLETPELKKEWARVQNLKLIKASNMSKLTWEQTQTILQVMGLECNSL